MRKIRKIWCGILKIWAKNTDFGLFSPILNHFWPKKGQFWIFGQKAKLSLFYSYGATASWGKSEKSDASFWKYEQKTLILGYFGQKWLILDHMFGLKAKRHFFTGLREKSTPCDGPPPRPEWQFFLKICSTKKMS